MTRQDPDRARRLAETLRENLRRRKAQGRERAAEAPAAVDEPASPAAPSPR